MTITNPLGAYGGASDDNSRGGSLVPLEAETAISAKQLVALGTATGKVIKALTDTAPALIIGVAEEDIAVGRTGLVCIAGPCFNVKKDGVAITKGDKLTRSAATAGSVKSLAGATGVTTVADTGQVIGIAMEAATDVATTVDVFVGKF